MNSPKQRLFNRVVNHLRKQGKQSKVAAECRYRSVKNGQELRCAIGALIPDSLYDDSIEGTCASAMANSSNLFKKRAFAHIAKTYSGIGRSPLSFFLDDLQDIHDDNDPSEWEEQFEITAREHNLTYAAPKSA